MTSGEQLNEEFDRLIDEGFEHFYVGEWDRAEELYEEARKLKPESGVPLVLEGRSRVMQGRLDEAIAKFHEALEVEPECVQAYEGFASVVGTFGGDHVCNTELLLYALQLKPERGRTWSLLLKDLEMMKLEKVVSEAADVASQYAVGETESAFDLRCVIYDVTGKSEEFRDEAERFREQYPKSKTAEMHCIMSRPDPVDDTPDYQPNPEHEPDEDFDKFIEHYAETFRIDKETEDAITSLWRDFLDRKIPRPIL